ncbi:hypothetical protein [Microbulbifer sp. ZKSA002]|uniref:hypothetical protein n=1 Tax=Microbulbifer sp. ZKSA002 TaxID=3243388 RepID=UPI00403A1259
MFGKEIVEFSRNLESLREFVELVDEHLDEKNNDEIKEDPIGFAPLMLAVNKQNPEEFSFDESMLEKMKERFGSKIELVKEESKTGTRYLIGMDENGQKRFTSALDKISKNRKRKASLYQSSLVTIISYVEWFLAQLIHKYYDKNPDSIGLRDKQLSLNDLYEIGSIEDAKKYLIDTKVESVLRGSISDWIKFLREQMKLSMSYLKDYQEAMIEACQRRNLYVHNGGVVNSIYLKNCSFADSEEPPKLGDHLTCDGTYIENILTIFEKSFLLIASELWKKNEPENKERYKILVNMSFDHICNERYDIGASIAYFLCGDKRQKESSRMTAQINYWQAKKWQGAFSTVEKEIKDSDFSAKDPIFLLARYVLLDQMKEAFDMLPDILRSGKLCFTDLSTWPLFKILREEEAYIDIKSEFDPESKPTPLMDEEEVIH